MAKLFSYFSNGIDTVCNLFIRPPRQEYDIKDLGPQNFTIKGQRVLREDFTVKNKRGKTLQCSFYRPLVKEKIPVVIFLHGNSGGRMSANFLKKHLLPRRIGLITLDFQGSGMSQGDNISLGWFESQDLDQVMCRVHQFREISKNRIAIWGYSMGAVTAIMFQSMTKRWKVQMLVLDSPFANLRKLTKHLIKQKTGLPDLLISPVLSMISDKIHEKAKFQLKWVEPERFIQKINVPIFFMHGQKDKLVPPHNSKNLYDLYKNGPKKLVLGQITHTSFRPERLVLTALDFLMKHLRMDHQQLQTQQSQKLPQQPQMTQYSFQQHHNAKYSQTKKQSTSQNRTQNSNNMSQYLIRNHPQNPPNDTSKYLQRTKSKTEMQKASLAINQTRETSHLPVRNSYKFTLSSSQQNSLHNRSGYGVQSSLTYGHGQRPYSNSVVAQESEGGSQAQTGQKPSMMEYRNALQKAQICFNSYKGVPSSSQQGKIISKPQSVSLAPSSSSYQLKDLRRETLNQHQHYNSISKSISLAQSQVVNKRVSNSLSNKHVTHQSHVVGKPQMTVRSAQAPPKTPAILIKKTKEVVVGPQNQNSHPSDLTKHHKKKSNLATVLHRSESHNSRNQDLRSRKILLHRSSSVTKVFESAHRCQLTPTRKKMRRSLMKHSQPPSSHSKPSANQTSHIQVSSNEHQTY